MRNRLAGAGIHIALWWEDGTYPSKQGYTPLTPEEMSMFRIGPFCIAWERWREE